MRYVAETHWIALAALTCLGLAGAAMGCGGSKPPIQIIGGGVVFVGIVTSVEGSASVSEGEGCELRVQPTDDPVYNCRVEVRCAEEVLYGFPGSGFNRCATSEGEFIGARDGYLTRVDGDPAMGWNKTRRLLLVTDAAPDFRVVVSMAAD